MANEDIKRALKELVKKDKEMESPEALREKRQRTIIETAKKVKAEVESETVQQTPSGLQPL